MSRRAFGLLSVAIAGGVVGAGATGTYSLFVKDDSYQDKIKRVAAGALAGGIIFGGLYAAYSDEGREVLPEIIPVEAKYPVTEKSKHIKPEQLVFHAANVLSDMLEKPIHSMKRQ